MKYELTTNFKKVFGVVVFQIKSPSGRLGGYVDLDSYVTQNGATWIHPEGAVIRSTIMGECSISGVVIDSEIKGKFIIGKGCKIKNCRIVNNYEVTGTIPKNSIITNQTFEMYNKLLPEIAAGKTIKTVNCGGVQVILGDTHFQIGCLGGTYQYAIDLLNNPEQLQIELNKASVNAIKYKEELKIHLLSMPSVQKQLLELAKKQLKRESD